MIILGISLLRLGDLILQRPLVEGLRQKYPQSEIHLLLNKQFSDVEFLFAGLVDKFIYFDREALQKSCGEKEYNILWGFKQLQGFVEEVNQTPYDVVYNFTHNRLSAHLAGLILSARQVGIYSRNGTFFGLANPWIQFFNSYFGRPEASGFHYTELLARALEINLPQPRVKAPRSASKPLVLIQPLTSDAKKNWNLERYKSLLQTLKQQDTLDVKVLGAAFEKDRLTQVFSENDLLICDLQGAEQALKAAALLVTGDTSIKHLAALHDVPILELSLGSSQPLQVGAYSNNSIMLQSRVRCGPCPHSAKCDQPRHHCAELLEVKPVYQAARMMLALEPALWESFAQKYPELNVMKTEIGPAMGWTVQCLSLANKNKFDEVIQAKTMIVEELNRRQELNKGAANEQRTRKLSGRGVEAP